MNQMSRRARRGRSLCALGLVGLWLSACGMFGGARPSDTPPPKAPVRPVSGSGASVTVGNEQSGSPVELGRGQQLTVRLRFEGTTHSDWTLLALEPGVLREVGATRYEQDPTAAVYGEVAGTQVWRFEPVGPGQALLRFELRMPRSRAPATETASYAVSVR